MNKYAKNPDLAREWHVEFYGPEWGNIVERSYDPYYLSRWAIDQYKFDCESSILSWRLLEGNLRQKGYQYVRYRYPKSMKECLRVIKTHEPWFVLDNLKFRLAHENGDVIPYEAFGL